MAERGLLHRRDLLAFKRFCETRGYVAQPSKGEWEVLRMWQDGALVLVYDRRRGDHLTVYGAGLRMVRAFIAEKRKGEPNGTD